jgi:hypothetical protein
MIRGWSTRKTPAFSSKGGLVAMFPALVLAQARQT